MPTYVALLRGIGPGNPAMANERLRGVAEGLGFENVRTVISSGNVIFESPSRAVRKLEATIERAWPRQLGFVSTTIVRSRGDLRAFADRDPFRGREHGPSSSLNVTFLKRQPPRSLRAHGKVDGRGYEVLGVHDRAVFSVVDSRSGRMSDLMAWLEKGFGKEITTRTWMTVLRILDRME